MHKCKIVCKHEAPFIFTYECTSVTIHKTYVASILEGSSVSHSSEYPSKSNHYSDLYHLFLNCTLMDSSKYILFCNWLVLLNMI